MNELSDRFGDKLVILAFPCNQFGHQENTKEFEILNSLKYVRPGAGFEPKAKLFSKVFWCHVSISPCTTHIPID